MPLEVDTEHPHVVLRGGVPMVRGSSVTVHRLWFWHASGVAVAMLVRRYPTLSWAKVLDALSYAHGHKDDMRKELAKGLWNAP